MSICRNCEEETDRLIESPKLLILSGTNQCRYRPDEGELDWHAPGQGYPGTHRFTVLEVRLDGYIARPEDACDQPMCAACWAGQLWPALFPYLTNKPADLRLNGWRPPEWIAPSPSAPGEGKGHG